jgi:hypothetical protein
LPTGGYASDLVEEGRRSGPIGEAQREPSDVAEEPTRLIPSADHAEVLQPVQVLAGRLQGQRGHGAGVIPAAFRCTTETIIEVAMVEGRIQPGGTTPEASMNTSVKQEVKKCDREGNRQRF